MGLQDVSAYLNYPDQENLNVGSSGNQALLIERFDGRVHTTRQKDSITTGVWAWKPLIGTDTMSNAAMGNPTLSAVVAGVEPAGSTIEVGKMIVQVKTPIIAKVITPMLAQVQDHLDIKSRTPENFGKKIAKHEDITLLLKCIHSALYEHVTLEGGAVTVTGKGTGGILPMGTVGTLALANDEKDAAKLEVAISALHQGLAELDLDPMTEGYAYMRPEQYFTLLKSDKLISTEFSAGNGNFAGASVLKVSGLPIKMTNRIMNTTDTVGSPRASDSIAALYGSAYETSAIQAKCKVLYATGDTIMVATSIPLTTEVFWDNKTLCWYIQSYEAFGAAPDRTDLCGAIFAV